MHHGFCLENTFIYLTDLLQTFKMAESNMKIYGHHKESHKSFNFCLQTNFIRQVGKMHQLKYTVLT